MNRTALYAALAAALFLVLVVGGSVFTSSKMNQTADTHGTSAGRSGDPQPNTIQNQSPPKSQTNGAVPNIR